MFTERRSSCFYLGELIFTSNEVTLNNVGRYRLMSAKNTLARHVRTASTKSLFRSIDFFFDLLLG